LNARIATLCIALAGCAGDPSFHCADDAQCGADGRCEATGYCSVEDTACSAGRRYDSYADDLAGRCLESYTLTFGERTDADVTNVTDDTQVHEDAPANNYGIADSLACNETPPAVRSLLRFELVGLPADATLETAELSIVATSNDGNSVELHPILEAWTEGTQNGGAGAPSWTEREPAVPWGTAGLAGSPSIEPGITATIPPSIPDQVHTVAIDDVALLRGWRDDPATNHGWLLRSSGGNGVAYESSEAADASKRPVLLISFRR
jgi:hypothetical protein